MNKKEKDEYGELLDKLKQREIASVKIRTKELVPFIKFLNRKRYWEKLYISRMSGEFTELKK